MIILDPFPAAAIVGTWRSSLKVACPQIGFSFEPATVRFAVLTEREPPLTREAVSGSRFIIPMK